MNTPFIDPELRPLLTNFPDRPDLCPENIDRYRSIGLPIDVKAHFPNISEPKCHHIKTGDGSLSIYEFWPSARPDTDLALLWIHGGGYVTGHGKDLWFGALFAERAEVRVFCVDYRLAPEHPYPAALNDCTSALDWLADQARSLDVDPSHIAIGGASAGGGLAAALAIHNRNRGGPAIKLQLLLYPMIDHQHDNAGGRMDVPRWPLSNSLQAWDMYLGNATPCPTSVPSLETDFAGLPPAFLSIGQADLFLDDVRLYAEKLEKSGLLLGLQEYAGVFHAGEMFGYDTQIGRQMTDDYVAALANGLRRD